MTTSKNLEHIAVIIDSVKQGGGAEKNAVRLVSLLTEAGYKVTLLTFYSYIDEYRYSAERLSFNERPQKFLFLKLLKAFKRLFKIKKFCRTNQVSHVISFLDEANTYTILTRLLLRNSPQLIVSVRADPTFASKRRQWFIRKFYRYADSVVAVSRAMEEILKSKFGLLNTTTIYNSVDVDLIAKEMKAALPTEYQDLDNKSQNKTVFINVGRLEKQKGQVHLIKSFAEILKKFPQALLIIAGEGSERGILEQVVKNCGVEEQVFLVGQQQNIYPFMRIADCFVFPSLFEGFPNALLEAVASGLYVISTDCPTGPREIISQGTLGKNIKYPLRVDGASLLPDISMISTCEKIENILSQEMMWFMDQQGAVREVMSVKNFTGQEIGRSWINLIR